MRQWFDPSPTPPPWTTFEISVENRYAGGRTREQAIDELVEKTGLSREHCEQAIADLAAETIYVNSRYQVNVRRQDPAEGSGAPPLVHLSIKCIWNGKRPPGPERFRDFQRIKNELVGPECEATEVYPAESRLVDTSNQFHLWVFDDPTFRIPWGFGSRLVTDIQILDSVQQPFEGG
jgi:hypothetical protein